MEIPHMITIPIIYIFLMIAILAIYFKNNSIKETKAKLKLADYPFPIQIYAYNNVPKRRLFWLTFIDLIDRGFYKLTKRNGISYIEVSNVNKESLNNFEKKVLTYLNNIIKDKQLTIDQFEFLVKTNLQYGHVRMEFLEELKKVATKRLGNIDHLSDYMVPFIISMLYFMQVLYFINKSFDISILLLLAIPLSLIFVFVAEKSRTLILKTTTKKFQITLFVHIILSFVFFYIWSKTISTDYILYHMLMACLVYGVPILVMINAYAINTNNYFSNKQQSEIYAEVDKIKKTILKNNKIKNEHMKYAVALKVNGIYSSKYEELIRKLNI